jgi:L-histidine N-alpha-methyltransferase
MNEFFEDVRNGLSATPKSLSSKYFYDSKGDSLFQQLMKADEYYLSRCELEILREQSTEITSAIPQNTESFDLIELGAGDASKSVHLINALLEAERGFQYVPIDISANIIELLGATLPRKYPSLSLKPLRGDYLRMLKSHSKESSAQKFILFLGSNIGNMDPSEAESFCREVGSFMQSGDQLLIGFDLKKNPHQILAAYNDRDGLTRDFNLNLLSRVNSELQGNFNIADFSHYATYDPLSGACKSFLISLKAQSVCFTDGSQNAVIDFEENEPIFMEVSMKYSVRDITELAARAGFKIKNHFFDSKKWFVDTLWEKV